MDLICRPHENADRICPFRKTIANVHKREFYGFTYLFHMRLYSVGEKSKDDDNGNSNVKWRTWPRNSPIKGPHWRMECRINDAASASSGGVECINHVWHFLDTGSDLLVLSAGSFDRLTDGPL